MYDYYGKDRVSPDIARLYNDLLHVWRADTCAPRMRRDWKPSDPTLGQCSITSFLVQDIKGGEVYGVPLGDGNYHCYNVTDGVVFDLTSEQFGGKKLEYKCEYPQKREEHFVRDVLSTVYVALVEKGYDPVSQIVGYLMSGDPTYITSHMGARNLIAKVERDELIEELLRDYIDKNLK